MKLYKKLVLSTITALLLVSCMGNTVGKTQNGNEEILIKNIAPNAVSSVLISGAITVDDFNNFYSFVQHNNAIISLQMKSDTRPSMRYELFFYATQIPYSDNFVTNITNLCNQIQINFRQQYRNQNALLCTIHFLNNNKNASLILTSNDARYNILYSLDVDQHQNKLLHLTQATDAIIIE